MSVARENDGKGEGWIEWSGGKQPVEDGVLLEVKLRNGMQYLDASEELRWSVRSTRDIIAYKIHKESAN